MISLWNPLAHLGFIIVPTGYADPVMFAGAGSPYGAGVISSHPPAGPTEAEIAVARFQGKRVTPSAAKPSKLHRALRAQHLAPRAMEKTLSGRLHRGSPLHQCGPYAGCRPDQGLLPAASIPSPFISMKRRPRPVSFTAWPPAAGYTAAITMSLLVKSGMPIAGGLIGAGAEIEWPRPVRPDDTLMVESEVLEGEAVPFAARTRHDHGAKRDP